MKRFWEEGSGHSSICPSMRKLLRLLSADITLGILAQLAKCAMDVNRMAQTIEFDVVATSHCLKAMHSYSIVEVKREKQRHIYSLGRGMKVSLSGQNISVSARTAEGAKMVLRMPVARL
jgi:hypothetical protein